MVNREIYIQIEELINNKGLYCELACIRFDYTNGLTQEKVNRLSEALSQQTESFFDVLVFYMNRAGFTSDADFYKKAQIGKTTFSNIRNLQNKPKKETVLKCIIALKLTVEEATVLLRKSNNAFDDTDNRDIIIMFCLNNYIYDSNDIYDLLEFFGEENIY